MHDCDTDQTLCLFCFWERGGGGGRGARESISPPRLYRRDIQEGEEEAWGNKASTVLFMESEENLNWTEEKKSSAKEDMSLSLPKI